MNRTIAIALVAAALAGTIMLPTGSTGATGGATVPMKILIEGLQANDLAVLRLGVDDGSLKLAGPPLYEYAVNASSTAAQEIEINPELEDGHYLLAVDAPEKYFREASRLSVQRLQGRGREPGRARHTIQADSAGGEGL